MILTLGDLTLALSPFQLVLIAIIGIIALGNLFTWIRRRQFNGFLADIATDPLIFVRYRHPVTGKTLCREDAEELARKLGMDKK
jgi:hypothetical protein